MADNDRIIVIHSFDNLIEANIVKTKLDAHGIPCFLSGEHLTHLTNSILSGGVRLHIFDRDRDEVVRVMLQSIEQPEHDDLLRCPSCRSRKVLTFSPEALGPATLVKFVLQLSKPHFCLECETEFDH